MNNMINDKISLEQFISKNWNKINEFIDDFYRVPVPIYNSVDIRESLNKFAPVDNNIYPAGFNNLCLLDLNEAGEQFRQYLDKKNLEINKLGIIVESNTKNTFYLDHLAQLRRCLLDAVDIVEFISFDESLFINGPVLDLVSASTFDVKLSKAKIENNRITLENDPALFDFVIMNNDQSSQLNLNWQEIETPVEPTPQIGWFKRQKIQHFTHYDKVLDSFCNEFKINKNLLQAQFKFAKNVDFAAKEGLETLANEVDELLEGLIEGSKVFLKASQGTYGMGISVVGSGQEVLSMNRKTRNKMDIGKNKIKFTDLLIQEGVETVLKYDDMPAEVTIYLVAGKPVGGFMRANPLRDSQSNLNAKGMVFRKFCISEIRQNDDHKAKEAIYSIIARLSGIASGYEINEVI